MTELAARPGFNHNDFYHRFLLRQVPLGCDRALDVGCGTGRFARRLAPLARSVDAIDRAPEVIADARASSGGHSNIRYVEADVADLDLGSGRYDYIACLASIHHVPFAATVVRLRAALTPGGVLAVLGCYRASTVADHLPDLIAIPTNKIANAAIAARARLRPYRPTAGCATAPVLDPTSTLIEIRRDALRLLPTAVVRRRLYWRYSLVYRRPTD